MFRIILNDDIVRQSGGKHAKQEVSVLGGTTAGKSDVTDGMCLDYLVSIPVVKAAIQRKSRELVIEPGKKPGSTIQLPFGHVQYFHRQLEFYQKLKKIQSLLVS